MICPYCDSDAVRYVGITDGGGDYGLSVCNEWECMDCGAVFEDWCVDVDEEEVDVDEEEEE